MNPIKQFIEASEKKFDDWEHMGKQDVHLISPVSIRNTVKFLFKSQHLALVEKIKEMVREKMPENRKTTLWGGDKDDYNWEIKRADEINIANVVISEILQDLTIK